MDTRPLANVYLLIIPPGIASLWACKMALLEVAVKVKASSRIHSDHHRELEEIKKDYPNVKRRIVVCLEKEKRTLSSGIEILHYADFFQELWKKRIIS